MKSIIYLVALVFSAPVVTPTATIASAESPTPTPTQVNNILIQPVNNDITNDNKVQGISGNASNRDQTNNAITQENNGKDQVVVGSQNISQDVNVDHHDTTVFSNSNTTVTNTDKSTHTTTNLAVSNDMSDKSQKTVNNHHQDVKNVYNIEQRVSPQPTVVVQAIDRGQQQSQQPHESHEAPNSQPEFIESKGNRIPLDLVREMIKNAKATSDLAYDMALRLTQ